MKKVVILGNAGAGKSTPARMIGEQLGLPVVHLDSVFWQAGWAEPEKAEFDARVLGLTAQEAWAIDGNYKRTLDARMEAAAPVVFLDLPRWLCLWRVIRRWRRHAGKSRPDMAAGCPEKVDAKFLRWIWKHNAQRRPNILERLARYGRGGKRIVRPSSPLEIGRFLAGLSSGRNFPAGGGSHKMGWNHDL